MSLVRYIDVMCDGCETMFDDGDITGTGARRSARSEGWATLSGGRDLCPECREQDR